MTTVSIVEDDRLFAELLTHDIRANKQLELVSLSRNGVEALADISRFKPAVALMDINLPRINGIECLRELKKFKPPLPTKVIVLTDYDEGDLVFEAIIAGAMGYLVKDHTRHKEMLYAAIRDLLAGEAPMSPGVARKLIDLLHRPSGVLQNLSERETEVLESLARGLAYKQVGEGLGISENTVRTHITSIYRKLNVRSATEAVVRFLTAQRPHMNM